MKSTAALSATELNRRGFVRLALMSSAATLGSTHFGNAEQSDAPLTAYSGPFRALPPGAITPRGWLRTYLEKQASQLGSRLPQVSWPFTEAYWAEEHEGESWWPWEQKAYWIDGATRLALVLQDEQLLAQVSKPIQYTLSHVDENGYLGPGFLRGPERRFSSLAAHSVLSRSRRRFRCGNSSTRSCPGRASSKPCGFITSPIRPLMQPQ